LRDATRGEIKNRQHQGSPLDSGPCGGEAEGCWLCVVLMIDPIKSSGWKCQLMQRRFALIEWIEGPRPTFENAGLEGDRAKGHLPLRFDSCSNSGHWAQFITHEEQFFSGLRRTCNEEGRPQVGYFCHSFFRVIRPKSEAL